MSLKALTPETMISITDGWTNATKQRGLLAGIPLVASLLPMLDEVHAGLTTTVVKGGGGDAPPNAPLEANRAEALATDLVHDKKARGTWLLHTALAELAEDPADEQRLLAQRDRLLPKGLSTVNLSYADEAGNVEVLKGRLDAPTVTALKRIKTLHGRTLGDEVTDWVGAGEKLGVLEAERVQLQAAAATAAAGSAPADVVTRKNDWIRVVSTVVSNLDLVKGLADDTRSAILGPLKEAEAKADRRGAGKKDPPAAAATTESVEPPAAEPVVAPPAAAPVQDAAPAHEDVEKRRAKR